MLEFSVTHKDRYGHFNLAAFDSAWRDIHHSGALHLRPSIQESTRLEQARLVPSFLRLQLARLSGLLLSGSAQFREHASGVRKDPPEKALK